LAAIIERNSDMRILIFYKRWLTIAMMTLIIIIGPTSCFFFESCPDVLPYFQIRGLDITNALYTGQGLNPWRIINSNETLKYDQYFMRIGFEKTFLSQDRISGGQNLYALSCNENGYAGSKVGVDTIYLIAQQDYNSRYLKGDTLNQILLTNYWTYNKQDFDNFFPLTQYIQENKEMIQRDALEIKIIEPPLNNNEFDFKLIFILKNGERFEKVSDKVTLTK
jgi:hypothetical protein